MLFLLKASETCTKFLFLFVMRTTQDNAARQRRRKAQKTEKPRRKAQKTKKTRRSTKEDASPHQSTAAPEHQGRRIAAPEHRIAVPEHQNRFAAPEHQCTRIAAPKEPAYDQQKTSIATARPRTSIAVTKPCAAGYDH